MRLFEISKTLRPPSISVGDEVKVGKWKNRKAEVKGFTKDDHGQPVLKTTKGDQKLYKPRVTKLEPEEVDEERELGKQYVAPQGNTHVVIFRAVPAGGVFDPMSYVTLNPKFAKDHAVSMANTEEEQYVVLRKMVPITDVYEAYNPGEYFYNGQETEGKVVFTANVGDDFYWQDK